MTEPAVLTTASTVTCAHQGKVKADKATKLRVGEVEVLLANAVGKDIEGCKVPTDTNTGTVQCTKVSSVTAGQSAKLTVGEVSVLLDVLSGLSNGTGPAPLVPTGGLLPPPAANQTRLRAAVAVT